MIKVRTIYSKLKECTYFKRERLDNISATLEKNKKLVSDEINRLKAK